MARRRRRSSTSGTRIVRVGAPRAAAPIIKVSAPRSAPVRRRRRGGRRRARVGGSGFGLSGVMGNVLGGAIFGFAVKQGWVDKLPAIPVIGRTGAAALALDYYSRHGGGEWARRTAMAAGVLAGYQLGVDGSIHGMGDASPDSYGYEEGAYEDEAYPG